MEFIKENWVYFLIGIIAFVALVVLIVALCCKNKQEPEKKIDAKIVVEENTEKPKQEEKKQKKVSKKAVIKHTLEEPVKKDAEKAESDKKASNGTNKSGVKTEPKNEVVKFEPVVEDKASKKDEKEETGSKTAESNKLEKEEIKPTESKVEKKNEKAETKEKVEPTEDEKKEEKMTKETAKSDETYRVVYDKEEKNWIVRIDGGKRASRRCATKAEALEVAKDLAKKKNADLSVHKKNGKFQKQK